MITFDIYAHITDIYRQGKSRGDCIDDIMNAVTSRINAHDLNVDENASCK